MQPRRQHLLLNNLLIVSVSRKPWLKSETESNDIARGSFCILLVNLCNFLVCVFGRTETNSDICRKIDKEDGSSQKF